MRYTVGRRWWFALLLLGAASPTALAADSGIPGRQPLYAFCGVGDHLWNHEVEPVDSPATIDAMFEWMSKTYGIRRMYWREERIWDDCYKVGDVHLEAYDWHTRWKRRLIRDLRIHEAAVASAKKHKMEIFFILDSKEPDCVQPWWGHVIPGTGRIRLDWRTWIAEGLVDEFWVQLGETADQTKTLDVLLKECRNRPVKLTVRTVDPGASHWRPYVAAGVTPVAVITWTNNGIERYSRESTCADSLKSADWRLRAQALKDVATARLRVDAVLVAPLAQDPHVLVRRQSAYAVATLGNREFVPLLEALLLDAESSVRIAAADALKRLHGSKTPRRILEALEKDAGFQFKLLCSQTLGAMKDLSLPVLEEGLRSRTPGVREVCVRALYTLGKNGLLDRVEPSIRAVMLDPREECQIRCWAVDSLVGLRIEMNDRRRTQLLADLVGLLQDGSRSSTLRIHAATGLGHLAPLLAARQREQAVEHLGRAFVEYGDGCVRGDAAYGWRPIGNALLEFGPAGRMSLEQMRVQAKDTWLAWIAYEVMYSVQKAAPSFNLVPQGEAIRNHEKYAPRFPGWRNW